MQPYIVPEDRDELVKLLLSAAPRPGIRVLASGRHVIMDIDVQGARDIRRAYPKAVSIFGRIGEYQTK